MKKFEDEVADELNKMMETDDSLVLLVKIAEFANWLEEGVNKTNNPMLKKVQDNYMNLFGEHLQIVKEAGDNEIE